MPKAAAPASARRERQRRPSRDLRRLRRTLGATHGNSGKRANRRRYDEAARAELGRAPSSRADVAAGARWMSLCLVPKDEQRPRRRSHHALRDTTENEAGKTTTAVRADHDEVGSQFGGHGTP